MILLSYVSRQSEFVFLCADFGWRIFLLLHIKEEKKMGASNKVIAGDYNGKKVSQCLGDVFISAEKDIYLDKNTLDGYEVVEETSRKSASSAIVRAGVGAFLLGPVGLAAGLSAKSKGIHTLTIVFKDGKRSLIEVDDKIYKAIVTKMF